MQIVLLREDLTMAPASVRAWIRSCLLLQTVEEDAATEAKPEPEPEPEAEPEPKPEPEAEPKPEPEPEPEPEPDEGPDLDYVKAKALDLLKSKGGTGKLTAILNKMDVVRVTECPKEKLAALLAAIITEV